MLEFNKLCEMLDTAVQEKRCFCRKPLRKAKKLISTLKKYSFGANAICFSNRDTSRWFFENFPRLEETVKIQRAILKRSGKLLGSGGTPVLFDVFAQIFGSSPRLSGKDIKEIFKICGSHNMRLEDCAAVLPVMKISICIEICNLFLVALKDKNADVNQSISDLFYTLDETDFVDVEAVYCENAVEKTLASDPSGVYLRLTAQTRALYRKNLIKLSKRRRVSQNELAKAIVEKCKNAEGNDRHIGKYLCDKAQGGEIYVFLVFFLTFVFTLLLCFISPVFILSVFSVYGCARLIADKFYVRFFVKDYCLPAVELDSIPDCHGVITVITSLLTGGPEDEVLFERLEMMYHSNGGKNVYFGLLCDLPDSQEEWSKGDGDVFARALEKILELRKKYGNSFFLFLRQREYSESEERYIAPERKRGAVNALVSFLCGKSDAFCDGSIKPDEKICRNIKYVFTLDADTNLAFDCLKRMTGIMMHPQNVPVVDSQRNAVIRGYGILQPAVNPTLSAFGKSFFSAVMCGHPGTDLYSLGGSDHNMSLFGRSIFCGKGMFEKNCFYETLCGERSFRINTILSHDAPEGARLRCAYVPDVVLTDSFPSEELSYFKRQHRWIRGDLQNLPFLGRYVPTDDGGRIRNGIGFAARFFIWNNVYSALLHVFTPVTIFVSLFCEREVSSLLVGASLAVYILPFGYSVLSGAKRAIWQNFRRLYFSQWIYTGVWTSFLRMLFCLCAMPKSAAVSLDALVRSMYRTLVSHKHMLEWTTSAQNDAEKRDGLLGYIKKNLINAFCGFFLFVLSPTGILRLLGLLWLFMPVFAYHSGKQRKRSKNQPDKYVKQQLLDYCCDMWKFFSNNVSKKTNHLPPDNVSFHSEGKLCRMTSPTNIGLYLLSVMCASKLGFADRKETFSSLISCLESVLRLEKHKGLLYNWYDIFKAQPLEPRYISSVDLGNLAACLVCVKEGVRNTYPEFPESDRIYMLCTELLSQMDFSILFDGTSKLFYIGALEKDGILLFDRNRYDMLMSEARILSFYAVAQRQVPSSHMKRLSRSFIKGKGYMGLASWNGTAFEYFMPEIFMPSKKGCLVYEALCFAYMNMRKHGTGSGENYVFGISESCFGELDASSNYGYYAFGVPEIAVNVFEKQNIISPYSSFLFMKMNPKEVVKNLERLKRLGAYGEYGFYESVDFERQSGDLEYTVVKCFMSHHIGMSLAACTNFLCDGAVFSWFASDVKMKSALVLTDEKIPSDAYVKGKARRHYKQNTKPVAAMEKEDMPHVPEVNEAKENKTGEMSVCQTSFHLMSSDRFSAVAGEDMLGKSFVKDIDISITEIGGEKLLLDDGFDLCKNSLQTDFGNNKAVYGGEYGEKRYKIEVLMPCGMPCKIIRVSGLCEFVSFDIKPSEKCDGERHIGAGLVFFGKPEQKEKGFAFGLCRDGEAIVGGEYSVSETVRVKSFGETGAQTVFCIGKSDEDTAVEIYNAVRNDLDGIVKRAEDFAESIRINKKYADEDVMRVLGKYFAYPDDNTCQRVFVKKNGESLFYDNLLLMYTDYPQKREFLIKAFDNEASSDICAMLLCLAFSEYVRLTKDKSVSEFKIKGKTLYKQCLAFLNTLSESSMHTDLYVTARKCFSQLCISLGDTRTAILLSECIGRQKDAGSGELFL